MGRTVSILPDTEIRRILVERIDQHQQGVGLVAGVIEPQGRRIVSYGSMTKDEARPIDGDTVFEIGSITKVFTALILTGMVEHGEVALADPVARFLPSHAKVPERGGRQITLHDLATHTSGLPRDPTNYVYPTDLSQPLLDYSVDQLYEFLSGYELTRDIGSAFEYSNLGVALLGHALELRTQLDYETLLKTRVLDPLGMNDTGISLTPGLSARLATGYGPTASGVVPVPGINNDVFACAGSLRSTANDMLVFLAAALGYTKTPLAQNFASMLRAQRSLDGGGKVIRENGSFRSRLALKLAPMRAALGWVTLTPRGYGGLLRLGNEIASHDGATHGYQSYIGFAAKARAGVVVLSNSSYTPGVSDIGLHLLNPRIPLLKPAKHRNKITLDAALLESYVGRYQFPDDNDIWTFRREGHRMFGSHPGEEKEIFAENETTFSVTVMMVVQVQIVFIREGTGPASGLLCRIEGMPDRHAKRI